MTAGYRRIDMWLWYARIARQRPQCATLCETGLLKINRQPVVKAHARLHIGDVLTLPALPPHDVRVIRIVALGERRGSAAEARLLYEELRDGA